MVHEGFSKSNQCIFFRNCYGDIGLTHTDQNGDTMMHFRWSLNSYVYDTKMMRENETQRTKTTFNAQFQRNLTFFPLKYS